MQTSFLDRNVSNWWRFNILQRVSLSRSDNIMGPRWSIIVSQWSSASATVAPTGIYCILYCDTKQRVNLLAKWCPSSLSLSWVCHITIDLVDIIIIGGLGEYTQHECALCSVGLHCNNCMTLFVYNCTKMVCCDCIRSDVAFNSHGVLRDNWVCFDITSIHRLL